MFTPLQMISLAILSVLLLGFQRLAAARHQHLSEEGRQMTLLLLAIWIVLAFFIASAAGSSLRDRNRYE
jgi:peptidoglycan biosynthesis protein MviN/MurJ (putative lipid II flippase)